MLNALNLFGISIFEFRICVSRFTSIKCSILMPAVLFWRWPLLLYFSLTLFVSATLLFLVQPMIGKIILPQLGGTPAVWNTCMVFFQGVLLVGYGYTHLLTTSQTSRRQVLIHGILLFLPFLVLPFSLGDW